MDLDPNYKPKARPDLLFRELSDGGIIYEPQTDTIHSLNASAAFIWALCDGMHTISTIIALIKANFSQFESEPEYEVENIIEKFKRLKLLVNP